MQTCRTTTNFIGLLAVIMTGMLVMLSTSALAADETVAVTDIVGRVVTLPHPARKIVMAEGRQIIALSLIDPAPIDLLAGWLGDFRKNDSQTYALYRKRFPKIDSIPVLGLGNDGTFSVERAISVHPDVAILGLGFAPGGHANDIARQLEAAGIPVVFTDFLLDPFHHTTASVRILGKVIGRSTQAEDFISFYESHMRTIAERLSHSAVNRPSILVETHAGMADCCFAPGHGNIGSFVDFVAVDSISAPVIPGPAGHLGLEYVLAKDPEIYVATGGAHLAATGGLVIGPGYSAEDIQKRLAMLIARPGFSGLRAVRDRRVHGLFHNLLTNPLNILAVENLAKWGHPKLFTDLDPAQTMAEINRRFLAVPMEGIYWSDLQTPP